MRANAESQLRSEIKALEYEIESCPAVSYHTQKPEDIGACVHPWNKVYEGEGDDYGRTICMACNEVLIEPFPEEEIELMNKDTCDKTHLDDLPVLARDIAAAFLPDGPQCKKYVPVELGQSRCLLPTPHPNEDHVFMCGLGDEEIEAWEQED
ncbi:hypothetical protein LCGC14_0289500 [marine sediment metagenome]|uniref:Uncharacterized protein n=1 Tax=marine sediment metagenome TaxID=412755 RepID=A0A0F9WZI3_9ZZZZ